jgi:hypothetical protein
VKNQVETSGRDAVLVEDAAWVQVMGHPILEALPSRGASYEQVDPFILVHEARLRLSDVANRYLVANEGAHTEADRRRLSSTPRRLPTAPAARRPIAMFVAAVVVPGVFDDEGVLFGAPLLVVCARHAASTPSPFAETCRRRAPARALGAAWRSSASAPGAQ